MNRRAFFSTALAGAISSAAWPALRGAEARGRIEFGLQLYTVRKELAADMAATLERVAALGIRTVEFAGYHGRKASEIKSILRKTDLSAPSAHIDLTTLRNNLSSALEAAASIGHKYLVLGYLQPAERVSLDDYKRLAADLNKAGAEARRAGIRLAYHNHDFEFTRFGDVVPYDLLLEQTDPKFVEFELDTYWVTRGGKDPVDYLKRHAGRYALMHLKDMNPAPDKSFTEIGRGVIDFAGILKEAGKRKVRHYFIEQDITPGDPFLSIAESQKALLRLRT